MQQLLCLQAGHQSEHAIFIHPLKTTRYTPLKTGRRSEHTIFGHPLKITMPTRPESRLPVGAHYFWTPFENNYPQDPGRKQVTRQSTLFCGHPLK